MIDNKNRKGQIVSQQCAYCGTIISVEGRGPHWVTNPANEDHSNVGGLRKFAGNILGVGGLWEAIIHQNGWGMAIAIIGGILYVYGNEAKKNIELKAEIIRKNFPYWKRKNDENFQLDI